MVPLTLVSSRNDHHCPQFSHGLRINENPACLAPVAPSPTPAALSRSPWPSSQSPAKWDEPSPARWWVDGIAPLLLTFTVWQWLFCFTGPAAWVSAKLGACLLLWVSLLPRAWLHPRQAVVQLPGFSFLRLLQPHPCLSPTGNTCGQWNMPRLHMHLGTPWARAVLMEHHLPDGAAAGAGFPEPSWEHSGLDLNLLPFLPLGILSLELSPLTCFFFYTPFYSHWCYLPGLVLPAHSDSCNGLLTTPGLASSTLWLFNQSKSSLHCSNTCNFLPN